MFSLKNTFCPQMHESPKAGESESVCHSVRCVRWASVFCQQRHTSVTRAFSVSVAMMMGLTAAAAGIRASSKMLSILALQSMLTYTARWRVCKRLRACSNTGQYSASDAGHVGVAPERLLLDILSRRSSTDCLVPTMLSAGVQNTCELLETGIKKNQKSIFSGPGCNKPSFVKWEV